MDSAWTRVRAGLGASVVVLVSAIGVCTPHSVAAASITVSGVVYRDLDNDGVRDVGEPGVPGIRVHRSTGDGTPTTTTGADGTYVLPGLTPATSGFINVETGWFRSQCAKLTCAGGPGPDNDFTTANAFIKYPLANLTSTTSNLNVGLLPDWPGSAAAATVVGGSVPANEVDVAARLSWISSTCPGGGLLICRPGDTYVVRNQIHNQGTTPLTGVTFVLDLPAGDTLASGNPTRDVTLVASASPPSVTGINVSAWDPTSQSVSVAIAGTIPPGGNAVIQARGLVVGGPGTPGCVAGAPTSACPKGEPQGAPLTLAVTALDQAGDPDSFGPDCLRGQPITRCATGIHDKQVEPDEVDPVGHNVDASVGPRHRSTSRRDFTGSLQLANRGWRGGPLAGQFLQLRSSDRPARLESDTPASQGLCSRDTDEQRGSHLSKGHDRDWLSVRAVHRQGATQSGRRLGRDGCHDDHTHGHATLDNADRTRLRHARDRQAPETSPLGTAPTSPGDALSTQTDNDASATVRTRP